MQQMSNILLAGNGSNKSSQVKDTMQVSDNHSFLSVFNQANQTSSFQHSELADTKKTSELSGVMGAELDLSEPIDESDVALIFAQLDMALSFDKSKLGGKILPHDDIVSSENILTSDLDIISAEDIQIIDEDAVGTTLPIFDESLLATELGANLSVDSKTSLDESFVETISVPKEAEPNSVYLTSLPLEQMKQLTSFSSLTETELASLSHDDLAKIVDDFNLQYSMVDGSNLDLADADKTIPVAQFAAGLTAAKDVSKESATDKLPADMLGQQSKPSITASSTADKVNILGTATELSSATTVASPDSSNKTHLSVELIKPNAVVAGGVTDTTDKTINFDGFSSVDNALETKSLQNQSGFTPIHKSDVPQFQLALKQHGESQVQMQEMIQRFSPVMKQQLITMVSNGIQQAEIRLDPPELGHLMVKIQVNGDQTQVQFHVAQAQTRDLIEQAIPRLRDMLAQEGLQLADSHVSQGGGGRDGQSQESSQGAGQQHDLDENSALEQSMFQNHSESLQSGIDYYA